jgi:putative phosphoesterase
MRIGFVSDAHGNREGLLVCLRYLRSQSVDEIWFLGDAIGYMPNWAGVIDLLEEYNVRCLLGNHDQMALEPLADTDKNDAYGITQRLIDENWEYLSRFALWPKSVKMEAGQRKLQLVHGSPFQPLHGYIYPDTNLDAFQALEADAVFMGNTHRPFVSQVLGKCVANVGSCGLPRDIGNLASCAIYDEATHKCQVYRIPFDAEKLIETYKNKLHKSVVECLRRRSEHYVGILVD